MKKLILVILSMISLTTLVSAQDAKPQAKMEPWPGVTVTVLTDNDHVKILEITMAPGSVADWHPHPEFTTYALTDGKMLVEVKGKDPITADIKAGQASWSPALTHKVTNLGKTPITMILTEIKEMKAMK